MKRPRAPKAKTAKKRNPKTEARRAEIKELGRFLLAKNEMTSPGLIRVSLIARGEGVDVAYGPTGGCDAWTVRSGRRAWIYVNERDRGKPRARQSVLHELLHFLEHEKFDALQRIHTVGPKTGPEYQIEREANWLPIEVLMPESMFARHCGHDRPTWRDIDRIASLFGTSQQATAPRYAAFASSPCAVVECRAGRVRWVSASKSFRGEAVERRALEPLSFGAALSRGEAVPSGPRRVATNTWGSGALDVEMLEHAVRVPETGDVLVWLVHAPLS